MRDQHPAAAEGNGEPLDTLALIKQAVDGDGAAFHELVRRYHAVIDRWALVSLGDNDEAEDAAQQVLIKVHAGLATFRGGGRLTTWSYRITRNVLAESARTRTRQEELLRQGLTETDDIVAGDADAVLDNATLRSLVIKQLALLPPRQREVFQLADLDGFAPSELAEMLEVEQATVRTNLLKARRAIRSRMLQAQPKSIEEYQS